MPKIIENLNVDITCRSCLTECDSLSSLYSLAETFHSSVSLGEILCKLFDVKWTETLQLPSKICDACQTQLVSAYNFKLQIEDNETSLLDYLKRNKLYDSQPITAVDFANGSEFHPVKVKVEKHDDFAELNLDENAEDDNSGENCDSDYEPESESEMEYYDKIGSEEEEDLKEDGDKTFFQKVGNFKCNKCTSVFSTQTQLDFHKKIHTKGPIKFYCEECDKCFASNRNLVRHRKLHSKSKNKIKLEERTESPPSLASQITLEKLSSKIKKKEKLEPGSTTSSKLKPSLERNYGCEKCSAKFSTQSQLDCHMRAHNGKTFYCEKCDRCFVNNRNLQRHLRLHMEQSEYLFKCSSCPKSFETEMQLKLHERTNCKSVAQLNGIDFDKNSCMPHETKSLECKICGLTCNRISLLRQHLFQHMQIDTIDRDYVESSFYLKNLSQIEPTDVDKTILYISEEVRCGRLQKFYSGVDMVANELNLSDSETEEENELNGTTGSHRYRCENCNEQFDRRYKILNHQRNNHPLDELKYECDICGMRYVANDLLDYHKRTQCYNEEKQFTCDVCKMKFMWKLNVEQHIMIHHSKSRPQKLIRRYSTKRKLDCELCHKKFSRPEHLDRHLRTHNPDEKKFECPTCKKKFSRKDNLRCHMKVHDEKRTDMGDENKHFLCVFCGRKFRNSSNLVVHTRRHTGEKPFKCDFCDKGFPRSSDLRTHRRTHTGEKPHLCNTCGKGFSRSNKLTRHMRIHTGDRPYKCTYCERAFTQSNDLTIHIRRHTGEKPYTCGICGERFIQGTALQNHRKTRGHYEDIDGVDVPFAHLSQNNPNPLNNASRVDQIGNAKLSAQKNNSLTDNEVEDIKPLKMEIIEHKDYTTDPVHSDNKQNCFTNPGLLERNSDADAIGSSTSFNYKDISSFVASQVNNPFTNLNCNLIQSSSALHNFAESANPATSTAIYSIAETATSPYENESS